MKKRILSMLMAICMVVGLIPATALHTHVHAEEVPTSTTIQVNGALNLDFTTTAKYAVTSETGAITGTTVADEATDPWNIKYQMVNGVAVMTLKGAKIGYYDAEANTYSTAADKYALNGNSAYTPAPLKIVVQESSSMAATGHVINANGSITSVTIESIGDAKLDMYHLGAYTAIAVNEVNFNNATLTRTKTGYSGLFISAKKLNVTGGDVSIVGSAYSGENFVVRASESAVIDGAKFYVQNTRYAKGLTTPSLTIKGGADVTLTTSTGYTGMLDVTDAVVEGDSSLYVYSAGTHAIVATGTFTVNSGTVKANCSTTPMTGALHVNGGKVILQSRGCKPFATVTPTVPEGACYSVKTGATVDVAATSTQTLEFLSGANTYQRQAEITFEHDFSVSTGEKVLDATRYNPAQYRAKCAKCGATSDTALVGVGDVAAAGTTILTLLTEYNGWVKWDFRTGYAQYLDVTNDTGTVATLTGAAELDAILNDTWDIKLEVIDGEAVMTLNGVNLGKYDEATGAFASAGGMHAFGGNSAYGKAPVRVIVKKDSTIASANCIFNSNTSIPTLTFESIGNAKLTMTNGGGYPFVSGVTDLNFVNANVEFKDTATTNVTAGAFSCTTVDMVNSDVTVSKRIYGYALQAIKATESITIDGGSFNGTTTLHGHVLVAPTVTIKNGAQVTLTAGSSGISGATDVNILDAGTKVVVYGQTSAIGTTNLSFGDKDVEAMASSQPAPSAMISVGEEYLRSALSSMRQVSIEVNSVVHKVTLPGGVVLTTSPEIGETTYAKTDANGVVTAGDADNWNIKFSMVDGVPTLTLKGATIGNITTTEIEAEDGTITPTTTWSVESAPFLTAGLTELNIVVEADSTITAKATTVSGVTDLTIESVGDAKLTLCNHGDVVGLSATTITLKNANLEMNTNGTNQWGKCITATTLNIDGGNVVINGKGYEYNMEFTKAAIVVTDLNISGGANVTVTNDVCVAVIANNTTISGDNTLVNLIASTSVFTVIDSLVINGGTVNVFAAYGHGESIEVGVIYTETGDITVNGGTLTVDKAKNANYTHGIWIKGAGSFTVNGGTVVANSGSARDRYGLYLQAGGTATINGGNVTITGYDHRDTVDAEGNEVVTNGSMGMGAVMIGEGSSFTVKGGTATFRSGVTPVRGQMNIEGGEVILISHKWMDRQFFDVAPVLPEGLCISMSNSEALDGADSIGSSSDMLTVAQAFLYCRIGAHSEVAIEDDYIKRPTCAEPGIMAQTIRCEHCLKVLASESEVEVPATGIHTPSGIVIENVVAPTLTATGSHDEVIYCNICTKELERTNVVDEAIGDKPAILVENVTVAPGSQNVVVNIIVANNPGIISAKLSVAYDADKLELVSFADGKLLDGWLTPPSEINNNPMSFSWLNSLALENNTGNGTVLTLTFNVKEGATGNAAVTISYDPENVFDFDFNNVTFVTANGGVAIQEDHTHSYNATVVPPAFGVPGYTLYECECGHSYTGDPTAALTADFVIENGKVVVQLSDGYTKGDITTVFIGNEDADLTKWYSGVVPLGQKYSDANGGTGYRYYSGMKNGSTVLLNGNGNYVVRLRYNDANGIQQTVVKQITLSDLGTNVPVIEGVDANNDLIITNTSGNKSWNISVFYIGSNTVSSAYESWDEMVNFGKQTSDYGGTAGYRSFTKLENVQLPFAGNYVVRIAYTDANGNSQMVCKQLAVANTIAAPTIVGVDEYNDLVITEDGIQQFVSFSVFYLGNKTVDQPYSDWDELVAYGQENIDINTRVGYRWYGKKDNVQLTEAGNYVVRLKYIDAAGIARFVAKSMTITDPVDDPVISMDGHSLVIDMPEIFTNPSASLFYLGNQQIDDPYNQWDQLVEIGKTDSYVNTKHGYRAFSPITTPTMYNLRLNYAGNYVVRVNYVDAGGVRRTRAMMITIAEDAVIPTITFDGNNVVVNKVDGCSGYILSVAYLKGQTLSDPYSQFNDMVRIGKYYSYYNGEDGYKFYNGSNLGNCMLTETGNYVIRLKFKGADGVEQLLAFIYNHTVVE